MDIGGAPVFCVGPVCNNDPISLATTPAHARKPPARPRRRTILTQWLGQAPPQADRSDMPVPCNLFPLWPAPSLGAANPSPATGRPKTSDQATRNHAAGFGASRVTVSPDVGQLPTFKVRGAVQDDASAQPPRPRISQRPKTCIPAPQRLPRWEVPWGASSSALAGLSANTLLDIGRLA